MADPLPSGSHPDVVEEHFEEAAFLYAQRLHLYRTGQATWDRLAPVERRHLAHVEGLVVAGPEAWPLVQTALDDDHVGAAHVAVRLRCRSGTPAAALDLVAGLEGPRVAEGVDALAHETTPDWTDALSDEVGADEPRRVRVAATVAGTRRAPIGAPLLRALSRADDVGTQVALVRALGALRYPPAQSVLTRRVLGAPVPALSRAAEGALLRFGAPSALRDVTGRAREAPHAALVLALAGSRPHASLLVDATWSENPGAPVALGVFGDPAHVPLLLDLLAAPPETAASAAVGLRVLTGAPLTEEALIPDDPDDPDLGGDIVVRPSQSPDGWRAWWAEHGGTFQSGTRYRAGRPFAPATAVAAPVGGLSDDLLPAPLRDALADELAGRYGLDAPFRADAFVADQRAALAALAEASTGVRAREGEWVQR